MIASEMKGLFSDAFTWNVRLPDGFAIHVLAGEELEWMPMFNNRGDEDERVAMSATIHLIRDADVLKPLRPVYSVLQSVSMPHLFMFALEEMSGKLHLSCRLMDEFI